MTPSGVGNLRKRGVLSESAAMRLLGNEVLPAQVLCFDHALAYIELFFPGTIENYQARLPHWQRDTSHLRSVAGRPSGAAHAASRVLETRKALQSQIETLRTSMRRRGDGEWLLLSPRRRHAEVWATSSEVEAIKPSRRRAPFR
jgi:hypothetical protein